MVEEVDPELEALRKKRSQQLQMMLQYEEERKLWPSGTIQITDADFQGTINNYTLVLVDFWAQWCMPCKMIAPVLDSLSREYQGKVVVAKLDVDMNRRASKSYGVKSIPTLILFKDGKPVERITGALPKAEFEKMLSKHISRDGIESIITKTG